MSVKKFKFVSPGIQINEIDRSRLPETPEEIGPVVVGRAERGPAGTPIKVNSYSEFVEIFGEPIAGVQGNSDVWREGNYTSPTYAPYAAKAWLRNNTPLTFIRLLGEEHPQSTTTGKAGWEMGNLGSFHQGVGAETEDAGGGAYGLFLFNNQGGLDISDLEGTQAPTLEAGPATASLAAIWYCDSDTTIVLSGAFAPFSGSGSPVTASQTMLIGTGSDSTFTALVGAPDQLYSASADLDANGGPNTFTRHTFNFDPTSDKYIRKVFNTSPIKTNSTVTTTTEGYFLGESFDRAVAEIITGSSELTSNIYGGMIVGLKSRNGTYQGSSFRFGKQNSHTGWFISQDMGLPSAHYPPSQDKLFRLVSLDQGEWLQNNLKVSIEDIRYPTNKYEKYGTFSVTLRRLGDKDRSPEIVEKYTGLNLNPNSPKYIKRAIGDRYYEWDQEESRYRQYGDYPNISKYVRVEVAEGIENGELDAALLPFGVYGPHKLLDALSIVGANESRAYSAISGDGGANPTSDGLDYDATDGGLTEYHFLAFDRSVPFPASQGILFSASINDQNQPAHADGHGPEQSYHGGDGSLTASFLFPKLPLRQNTRQQDISDGKAAYWGVDTMRSASNIFNESVKDYLRVLPGNVDAARDGSLYTEVSWIFSLDDVMEDADNIASYESGSRSNELSITAISGAKHLVNDLKYDKFTTVFAGGYDGLDITESDPFRNTRLDDSNDSDPDKNNYAYHSVKRAIDSLKDPEMLEFNIATMPGITNTKLTKELIDNCEERGDALTIIDLDNTDRSVYQPAAESTQSEKNRVNDQNIDTVVTNLDSREINSSYACTYYPWVQIRDENTEAILKVPPSVAALGTMSFSQAQQALWFAPAGFTRGGLSNGIAGLDVVGVTHKLTSRDRDKLYEANINPIASFPAEGLVVFGQKTLQVTPSALDRINVRRLLIFLKKEVSGIAATTLFEQNVRSTWLGFSSRVKSFLSGVKSQVGLVDYKVVLDETTTTPEMIDRNIMYAKIFIKPARAIEFIALDFIITDSGASFED